MTLSEAIQNTAAYSDGSKQVWFDWTKLSKADNPQATLQAKIEALGYELLTYGTSVKNGRHLVVKSK